MGLNERDQIRQLDHFWDRGIDGPDGPDHLDAALATTVRRLHALHQPPDIDPEFQRRLLRSLVDTGPHPAGDRSHRVTFTSNGHAESRLPGRLPRAMTARPWAIAQLATAALLLLTMVSSLVAFGPLRPGSRGSLLALPTILNAPARDDDAMTNTLFDESVADLPDGPVAIYLERWLFKPGPGTLTVPPHPGIQWVVADTGAFVATVDGVEHELARGDGIVVPANQELILRSREATNATVLRGAIESSMYVMRFDPHFISYRWPINTTESLPVGAVRIILEETTLPPGSSLPPFVLGEDQWIGLGGGTVGMTLEGDRLPLRWSAGEERSFQFPNGLPLIVPGTELTLRNDGEDQLLLYRLTIAPDGADAALINPASLRVPESGG
jgi:hypothetical protein